MTILLQDKIDLLEEITSNDVWYIVKQATNFVDQLLIISTYFNRKPNSGKNVEEQYKIAIEEYNKNKTEKEVLTINHRALRTSFYYGLLSSDNDYKGYSNIKTSEVYDYINKITNGDFHKLQEPEYRYLIRNQLEKIHIKSKVDDYRESNRKNNLFPIIFLYKILLELGKRNNNYSVSMLEFKTLITTTNTSKQFLDTITQIVQLRNSPESIKKLEEISKVKKPELDNRFDQIIKQLDTLNVIDTETHGQIIELNLDLIDHVREQVYYAEQIEYDADKFISFLTSNKTFKDLVKMQDKIKLSEKFISDYDQKIFFGPPGTGKSYAANQTTIGDTVFKTTIYPDYDYHTFIGSIMPVVNNGNITYDFTPGIFTKAIAAAFLNPNDRVSLIIDEMTRGNIAGIFGDIFQLLDRNIDGISESSINNDIITKYIQESGVNDSLIESGKLYLPSNFSIIGTINTSDQNVFVMDTAFKRRFMFEYVGLESPTYEGEYLNDYKFTFEDEEEITWVELYQNINKFIMNNLKMPEDKQVGPFFIKFAGLSEEKAYQQLSNKLLLYLWEDIETVKFNSNESLFDIDDNEVTFEKLFKLLNNTNPKNIFNDQIVPKNQNLSKKL